VTAAVGGAALVPTAAGEFVVGVTGSSFGLRDAVGCASFDLHPTDGSANRTSKSLEHAFTSSSSQVEDTARPSISRLSISIAIQAAVDSQRNPTNVVTVGKAVEISTDPEPAGNLDRQVGICCEQSRIRIGREITIQSSTECDVVRAPGKLNQPTPLEARAIPR
jgi:hypothetical protein